ncbi:MAG TPA: ATP-binding protein [Kofleriaceae bacterium]|jgi:two-component system sporulation sensor kinase A
MATQNSDTDALRLHALKNCASTISVLTRLLAGTSAANPRHLERLQATADRMTKLLCAALERQRTQLEVSELLRFVRSEAEPKAQEHHVSLVFTHMPASVAGEPNQLGEALLNLVQNAIEATPPGGHVRVMHTSDGGGTQYFAICDEGPGMPDEQVRNAGRFPVRSSKQNGSGVGLVLARQVVEDQGGQLDIVPSDQGTTVRVLLPAAA